MAVIKKVRFIILFKDEDKLLVNFTYVFSLYMYQYFAENGLETDDACAMRIFIVDCNCKSSKNIHKFAQYIDTIVFGIEFTYNCENSGII